MVLDADDDYAALKDYMTANTLDDLHGYCRNGGTTMQRWDRVYNGLTFNYGADNAYPQSVFIDRDGNIRGYARGAIDGLPPPNPFETLIDQLTGAI